MSQKWGPVRAARCCAADADAHRRNARPIPAEDRRAEHLAEILASLSRGGSAGLDREIQRSSDTSSRDGDDSVWVSKVNEFIGSSSASFEGAALEVVERANRTLRGITGIEILDKSAKVQDGAVVEYRVKLRLLFDMAPESDLHW